MVSKGYSITPDGEVISASGKPLVARVNPRNMYLEVRVRSRNKQTFPVPVHKFAAFVKFGNAAFERGKHVRHLDTDRHNNRPGNIKMGTPSQNWRDWWARNRGNG